MQREIIIDTPSGRLSAVMHIPEITPTPSVIVCHGFTSSKFTKEEACEFLREAGFFAVRFDFNGHGQSYGDFRDFTLTKCVQDLGHVVEYIKNSEHCNGSIGLTGTSLGAQVILIYASRNHDVKALVPVCAPFRWEDTNVMRNQQDITNWEKTGFHDFYVRTKDDVREPRKLSFNFVLDRKNYDMAQISEKIMAPTLLIHGDSDSIVPISHAKMYFAALNCEKKLVVLPGAGHNHEFTKSDSAAVFKEMEGWFNKHL